MDNNNPGQGFQYTYSAKEQEEIRKIREKYTTKENKDEDKMERLRRLDASVAAKAQIVSLILGVVGALILGTGMSLVMTDIGGILGAYEHLAMPLGIIIGVVGAILVSLAYPVYSAVLKWEKKRIAPEILRLTDELMK